jgi:hypothetical protein
MCLFKALKITLAISCIMLLSACAYNVQYRTTYNAILRMVMILAIRMPWKNSLIPEGQKMTIYLANVRLESS